MVLPWVFPSIPLRVELIMRLRTTEVSFGFPSVFRMWVVQPFDQIFDLSVLYLVVQYLFDIVHGVWVNSLYPCFRNFGCSWGCRFKERNVEYWMGVHRCW